MQIEDKNYEVALNILQEEFLDREALVEDLLVKLLDLRPKFSANFSETKIYLSEVKCIITDLQSYGKDLLTEPANTLLSHIVFHCLPNPFKQECVRRLNDNYPKLKDIFDNYVAVIRTLNLRQNSKAESRPIGAKPKEFYGKGASKYTDKPVILKASTVNQSVKLDQNAKTDSHSKSGKNIQKVCKFCNSTGHSMLRCVKYSTHKARVDRCDELQICNKCSS